MKKFRPFYLIFLLFFTFTTLKVTTTINAQTETLVNSIDGASIRIKTENSEQGLRFYAKLDESVKNNEHGFYLIFGNATVEELKLAISLKSDNEIILNGKPVFKVVVPSVRSDNTYSVVLTGIPEAGYFDFLSVIPYVVYDDNEIYAKPNSRSIASVILKMSNEGEDVSNVVSIDKIIKTDRRRIIEHKNGDIEIVNSIYEEDKENLKLEFLKDFNALFNLELTTHDIEEFYHFTSKPLDPDDIPTNKDLSTSNLYKFFNDKNLKRKWSWLLDLLIDLSNEESIYVLEQAKAVLGDGTYEDKKTYNGGHLTISIINFFNPGHIKEPNSIDFTNNDFYLEIKNYNNSIFIDLDENNLYEVGEEIYLKEPTKKPGYRFDCYMIEEKRISLEDLYTIDECKTLKANYQLINYAIKFYDGESELHSYKINYTVLDEFVLPSYEKDNHLFFGWYLNPNLEGEPVDKIELGTTENITLYAYFEQEISEEKYQIQYYLNDGSFVEEDNIIYNYTKNDQIVLPVPIKDGFTFAGWYLNSDFKDNSITTIEENSTGDINLYAKWTKNAPSDLDVLEDAYNELEIIFSENEKENDVKNDLTLLTNIGDVIITWNSSNIDIVSNKGIVNRTTDDNVVNLTALLTLGDLSKTKVFIITVIKISLDTEYTITFNLNGGLWPKTPDIPGYTDRTKMVTDFLTDFYNFVKPTGVSLTDFIHGVGKTSGFDGMYGVYDTNKTDYFDKLYAKDNKTVDASTGMFINQPEYNKWVPLLDLMEEYTNLGFDHNGVMQTFWGSPWTGARRIVAFMQQKNLWGSLVDSENVLSITGKIPENLKKSIPGVSIEVPTKYTPATNDITLPIPEKTGDPFIGWYSNSFFAGDPITKLHKGSSGNKTFYARYSKTEVPLTEAEKFLLAYENLDISYQTGDNKTAVTKNLTLPITGLYNTTVSWSSSNTLVVNNNGVVTRSESLDVKVTLIATITNGNLKDTKEFTVTVKQILPEPTDSEKVALAKSALNIVYASGDSISKVTKPVSLPKTGLHGTTIKWASSDTSTINGSGNVVRKQTDTKVTLTATITLGSVTDTKVFTLTVLKLDNFTISYNLNGGTFAGYTNKTQLANAFTQDLYNFVKPSETLTVFRHGAGKSSGFNGTWYSNEDYREKIYGANIKSGNNNYFLSSSSYQAKWKPLADFMVSFVKVGNAEQDFWSSPYTGNLRLKQYLTNEKPGSLWTDVDMAKLPGGLSANVAYEYASGSLPMTLPTVSRSGYTFEGWYENANFTGSKVTTIAKGETGNKTYYAKWSQPTYTITLNLNGGSLSKLNKSQLTNAFLNDLYSFIRPSENLTTFKHGAGKSSGFNGTWFTNDEHRAKIYGLNIKSGNNNYFLSSSLYQAKWKPLADFMVNFVKINPDQGFWTSPSTGTLRLNQYFRDLKPGSAWTNANMSATPGVIHPKKYSGGSQSIFLPNATRSKYEFLGWYTANTGGSKVTSIAANSTGNKTYYARWKALPTETNGDKILKFARSKIGGPYVWGGNGPRGYDCSGLTMAAYASVGISIPRVASAQANGARRISKSQLKPGDLVFWGSPATHVAIWAGNNKIVHAANPTSGIYEGNIYGSPYYGTYWW